MADVLLWEGKHPSSVACSLAAKRKKREKKPPPEKRLAYKVCDQLFIDGTVTLWLMFYFEKVNIRLLLRAL